MSDPSAYDPSASDPLAEVVTLLRPAATVSKVVGAAGRWRLRRTDSGQPFYCVVLHGACRLAAAGHEPITLAPGDFVLIPAAHDFTVSSVEPAPTGHYTEPVMLADGEVRLGAPEGPPDVLILVGHCAFGSPDTALLVSLLPQLIHVRDLGRLATLVEFVGEETRSSRPARARPGPTLGGAAHRGNAFDPADDGIAGPAARFG